MAASVNIYIENYLSKKEASIVEYTIDFHSIESAEKFLSNINAGIEYSPLKFYKLILPFNGKIRMFSGSWYSLPMKSFEGASFEEISGDDEGSAAYSGIIKVKKNHEDFSQYLTHVDGNEFPLVESIKIDFNYPLKELIVVDCGQGNWNEIYTDKELLIYDLGASSRYNEYQIKTLINGRFSNFNNLKIDIVISHWDMDHFQSLKHLNSCQLKKINAVYGPSNLPPSNVYTDAMNNLTLNNVKCYLIAPTTKRKGNRIDLNLLSSSSTVDLYRSVSGGSRNQTGIVLAIKGKEKVALLTGDHYYPKIFDVIENKYTSKDIVLVAPHHGGCAGNLSVKKWLAEFGKVECPISVGINSYRHPSQSINSLSRLQKSSPDTTQKKGSITFSL